MTTIGPIAAGGRINPHHMQGAPSDVNICYNFDAPIKDPEVIDYLKQGLSKAYPGCLVQVIGSFWDYSDRNNDGIDPRTGYYRAQINGKDVIVYVHPNNGHDCLNAADSLVQAMKNRGVETSAAHKNDLGGSFVTEHDGLYIHVEDFFKDAIWLSHSGVEGKQFAIGEMAGHVYHAGRDVLDQVSEMARITKAHDIQPTLDFFKGNKNFPISMPEMFPESMLRDLLYRLENYLYVPTTYNFIEKMISVKPNGDLVMTGAHDSAGRGGYLPMMTDNASYDVGMAVARIILNPSLYQDPQPDYKGGLDAFVAGYNKTSGKNLTAKEAVEAAKMAMLKNFAYSATTLQSGDYGHGIQAHIDTVLKPMAERFTMAEAALSPRDPDFSGRLVP